MAWYELDPPVAGPVQSYKVNGTSVPIDVPTYLTYLNSNLVASHGPVVTKYVAGGTDVFYPPAATAANSVTFNAATIYLSPIVFSTAGDQSVVITTQPFASVLHLHLHCTMECMVVQASVFPAVGFRVEIFNTDSPVTTSNGVTGEWVLMREVNTNFLYHSTQYDTTLGFYGPMDLYVILDSGIFPNTQYRITPLAGTDVRPALPATGRWQVRAGANDSEFEFAVWTSG